MVMMRLHHDSVQFESEKPPGKLGITTQPTILTICLEVFVAMLEDGHGLIPDRVYKLQKPRVRAVLFLLSIIIHEYFLYQQKKHQHPKSTHHHSK